MEVEVELGGLGHDLEPFGVGLHEPVLDAVVDHLDEMAGAGRPDVGVAALGGQGEEGGLAGGHRLVRTADHQAVALLQSPDAAGRAGVHQGDPVGGELRDQGSRLLVVGVTPVDDHVPGGEEAGQGGDGVVGRLAGRHHHPGHPGRFEGRRQLLQGGDGGGSEGGGTRTGVLAQVEGHDLVSVLDQPLGHVGAHLAESDHCDLHGCSSGNGGVGGGDGGGGDGGARIGGVRSLGVSRRTGWRPSS